MYPTGLRLGEATRLRLDNLLLDRRQMFIKAGKGKKDRYVILSDKILALINTCRKIYKPDYWLFEGQQGEQYSKRSVQSIMKRAIKNAGVNPYATVHTLRHSFATHLLKRHRSSLYSTSTRAWLHQNKGNLPTHHQSCRKIAPAPP